MNTLRFRLYVFLSSQVLMLIFKMYPLIFRLNCFNIMFKTTVQNICVLDVLSAILMFMGSLVLLIGFFQLNTLGPIQVLSGAVMWVKWIFLAGSIICFVLLLFYIFCVLNWFALRTTGKLSIIAELIYILGIYSKKGKEVDEKAEEDKKSIGGDIFKSKSKSASVESLYGFGHTEDEKWTFSGKKPNVPNSI